MALSPLRSAVLLIVPAVLILAQVSSWLSPDEMIHNYYTSSGNLINTWFVKKGWFWTSLAYFLVLIKSPRFQRRSLYRFGLVTLFWILFTQWLVGMPLMDRIFIWSGGQCKLLTDPPVQFGASFHPNEDHHVSSLISSMACKKIKGTWEGGHDPSGHVFLMSLSVCVLVTELLSLYNLRQIQSEFHDIVRDRSVVKNPSVLLVLIVFLSLMMLYMTGLKYHSISEKLSGLFVSYVVLGFVWWLLPDS